MRRTSAATVVTAVNPAVAVLPGVAVLHVAFGWATGVGSALVPVGPTPATRLSRPSRATTRRAPT
ncbi:MAG: hypothetical protein ACYCXY_08420 [Acidimicrobiales bacterium]